MAYPGGKLSAVDAILAEAADLVALEQIARLNTAHLAEDGSALPSSLESRFRKLKSFPAAPPPARTLGRSATAPPHHHTDPADPPRQEPPPPAQERRPEDADKPREEEKEKENSSPPHAHPPPAMTVPPPPAAVQDDEDLEKLFRPGRGRPMLRERNRGRDGDSPSPPRQACCFGFSPKKTLQRTPTRSGRKSHAGVRAAADDILGIGDAGEWGDENKRMVTELKQQQRKLKKALEEQVKVSRETAKMAQWVKQASARMTHTAAIDDLLSDCDDEDDLK